MSKGQVGQQRWYYKLDRRTFVITVFDWVPDNDFVSFGFDSLEEAQAAGVKSIYAEIDKLERQLVAARAALEKYGEGNANG